MTSYVYSKLLPWNVSYLKQVDWFRAQYTLKRFCKNPTPDSVSVLFKSKHFLIVNKPYDLVVYDYHKTHRSNLTLFDLIKEKFPIHFDPRLTGGFHVLHRLDSVTSGCICIPLNYFSQRIAVDAFRSNKVEKYYLALVYGRVKQDGIIEINVPIGEDLRRPKYAECTIVDKNGNKLDYCSEPKKAITHIKVLEYGTYKGKDCTKVLVKPITGKKHQIRVHLSYLGYPIVGDKCYGIDDYDSYRTMLHSYRLNIKIDTKERMFLKAKAPDPFSPDVDPDWNPLEILNPLNL